MYIFSQCYLIQYTRFFSPPAKIHDLTFYSISNIILFGYSFSSIDEQFQYFKVLSKANYGSFTNLSCTIDHFTSYLLVKGAVVNGTNFTTGIWLFTDYFIGLYIKKKGLFTVEDGHTISKIIVYITLPAAIIIGFRQVAVNQVFFFIILFSLCANTLLVLLSGYIWRNQVPVKQSTMMFGTTGYNIGNFALPFVQSFLPAAIPLLCVFDIGNALMVSGGSSVIVAKMTGNKHHPMGLRTVLKQLFSSPPFTIYVVMFFFTLFQFDMPQQVISIASLLSSGNGFLSMFMIGLYMEIHISKKDCLDAFRILRLRYLFSTVLAVACYVLLPFPTLAKQALVLAVFTPVSSLCAINAVKFGARESIVGFLSSASIIISLIIMTGLMLFIF